MTEEGVGYVDWLDIHTATLLLCAECLVESHELRLRGYALGSLTRLGWRFPTPLTIPNRNCEWDDSRCSPKHSVSLIGAWGAHSRGLNAVQHRHPGLERLGAASWAALSNVEVNRSKEGAAPAPQETCLTQESVPTIG